MYKIALCGKAGTGKNTAANLLVFACPKIYENCSSVMYAFADPIKEIIKTMFPVVNLDHLYGPSHLRNEIIPGALDADGNPLTVRRALLDIGTKVGRAYSDSIWLFNMGYRIQEAKKSHREMVIITDVRFRNEFDWLKKQDFFMIKIVRDNQVSINHISETGQNEIADEEYDFVLNNNGTIDDLLLIIKKEIISKLSYV